MLSGTGVPKLLGLDACHERWRAFFGHTISDLCGSLAERSRGSCIMPVARYSPCDIIWHTWESPVAAVAE